MSRTNSHTLSRIHFGQSKKRGITNHPLSTEEQEKWNEFEREGFKLGRLDYWSYHFRHSATHRKSAQKTRKRCRRKNKHSENVKELNWAIKD